MDSHPHLFRVEQREGDYNSSLKATRSFVAGDVICSLEGLTVGPKKYSTVQCGEGHDEHVELNSDLLYVNHSCEPNTAFDLSAPHRKDWNVRALKNIRVGDDLTFFYPSTEWAMAQPFDCGCGAKTCLGRISGASGLSLSELKQRGHINPHIVRLAEDRDSRK